MSITYTNRKGVTYHLCRGVTKTGKPRYYFAREPRDEPVNEIPQGYRIGESVNGVVSLGKEYESPFWPEEVAAVETVLRRHPQARAYRVDVRRDAIDVCEQQGGGADVLLDELGALGLSLSRPRTEKYRAYLEQIARYAPVLRFTLADASRRDFDVHRWCYRSRINGWRDLHRHGPVLQLAREVIPTLGTDDFFELW